MHKFKREFLFYTALIGVLFYTSCRKDFSTVLSSGTLTFSKDTIYLDTIFSNTSSSTRSFKVYNKSNDAISIPSISLEKGLASFYRLNVDGIPGKDFQDIAILAHDSIFVFVETTIDFNTVTNPLYTDKILFDTGINEQKVDLVTLVQDAHFLFPSRDANGIKETIILGVDASGEPIKINGFLLDGNTTFTNDKPYVIYGYLGVPENATLTIGEGVNLYFHEDSGIIVGKNASLKVNGTLDNKVVFQGDRREPNFDNVAGQWGTIWMRAGSQNNSINHTLIKNSIIGILVDSIGSTTTPTLQLNNTEIYNTTNFGLLGRETHIEGQNVVIANNGQSSLACTIGGSYTFTHCTFANYYNAGFRQFPTLLINNFFSYTDANGTEVFQARDLSQALFTNCIVDGNQNIEMILDKKEGSVFNYQFKNNLIKFNDVNNNFTSDVLYDFENTIFFSLNILNGNAQFKDVDLNQLVIGKDSEAISKADANMATQVPFDILGVSRLQNPDIGAYQHSEEF
ncbi:MAG: hypothetical protein L3J45_06240 [Flavobacteriaceae bacterium]|nr:hypothetical protein [Flavobacteriaceae bacterium]